MPGYFRDDTIREVVAANGEILTLNQAVAIASAFQYAGEQAEATYGTIDAFPAPLKDFLLLVADITFELVPLPTKQPKGLSVEDLDRIFGL